MNNYITDQMDQPKGSELDLNASEEKSETSFSETQQSDQMKCTSNTSRPGGFFKNLFRRDQKPLKTSAKVKDSHQDKNKLSQKEEELDSGVGENLLKQNRHNIKDRVNQPEDSGGDLNVSEMSFPEMQKTKKMMHTSNAGRTRGFSCPTNGFEDQKPTESKSALTVEEPLQDDDQKEPEICLQKDKIDKDTEAKMKDRLKTNQQEKKTINPLTFLKEELLKVFKDKDTDLEHEDCLLIQTQNKPTSSMLGLLKEDLSQFKEDVNISSSEDKDMSSDSKTSQIVEKSNHLSLLKDDPYNVARTDGLKEKDIKEDSAKITDLKSERTNELFTNPFRREQKPLKMCEKVDGSQEVKNMLSVKKDEHLDCANWRHFEDKNENKINTEKMNHIEDRKDQPEGSGLGVNVSEEKSETQQSDEMMCTSNTSRPGGFFKNLFRRDQKSLKISEKEDKPEVIIMVSEKKDKQVKGNLSEQSEDKNIRDRMNQPEDSELDLNVSEEKSKMTSFSETKQSEAMMSTSNTSGPTGFSCSAEGLEDQKPIKSKTALIVEEPSQENNHRESETCLQQDDLTHKLDQDGHADAKMKDLLKTNQREKRINPLTLLKEDLLKVFQDKHTKSEHEDCPLRQTETLPTGSTHGLLKEDLSQFKEDFSFKVSSSKDKDLKSSDSKTSQTAETPDNHLSLLKDDRSNVLRTDGLKKKDIKEDSSKITDLKAERSNEVFTNLFRREQKLVKTSEKVEDSQVVMLSEKKEEPLDSGFRGNLTERNEEKLNAETINIIEDGTDQPEHSELDLNVSEEKSETSFSETQQSDEMMCTSNTSRPGDFFKKLFRRDQKPLKTSEKLQDTKEVKHMCLEMKEEQLYSLVMGNLMEENKGDNVKDSGNQPKDSELDRNVSDETTFSETQHSEMTCTLNTGHPRRFPLIEEEPSQEKDHIDSEIHFQEDYLTHKFDQKDNKKKDVNVDFLKSNQREKRTTTPLTLLKEDFSHFKDDLFNVFRISLSKDKDNKEDSSQIEVPVAEDTKKPFKKEEELDSNFRGKLSEQNEETVNAEENFSIKDRTDQPEDSELDLNVSEEKSEKSLSEVQQSEGTMSILDTGAEDEKINTDEDDRNSEILPWEFSKISLLSLRVANKDNMRGQPGGDLWSPKNFATYLTFDPNTANSELHLMDGNRKATRYWLDHRYLDHPERFQCSPQVLCREGLLDSVYWEVEWSGGADIGVAYNNISRDGDTSSCLLGHNERSWSLECSEGSYTPCYNKKRFRSSSPEPFTHRVGVYLDWSAGTLSFYCVSQDTMVHLHTFTSTFTEPLYAGFWIWAYEGSVSLCQVKLDWERLQ